MENEVYPRTRKEDERLIVRTQESFSGGMVSDVEPTDLSPTQVAYLNNARGHTNAIKGRKGTTPFIGGALPHITDNLTLALAESAGVWTLTCTDVDDQVFAPWMVGCKVGQLSPAFTFIITKVVVAQEDDLTTNVVEVAKKDSVVATTLTSAYIRGSVNAIYSDRDDEIIYYQIGQKIYYREVNSEVWNEYIVLGPVPSNTRANFYKIDNRIVLFTTSGIYVLGDRSDGAYAWVANGPAPQYKINVSGSSDRYVDPSAYRYIYTYSRIKGNSIVNRNNLGTFIELETAPYFHFLKDQELQIENQPNYVPDFNNQDNTLNYLPLPIENSTYVSLGIGAGYDNAEAWASLSDEGEKPFLYVTYNGHTSKIYFDFSLVETLNDVAKVINSAMYNDVDTSVNFKLGGQQDAPKFLLYSTNGDKAVNVTAVVDANAFDLITEGAVVDSDVATSCGHMVRYLRYPTDRKDITHYNIYRTDDILPFVNSNENNRLDPRRANNPNIFGWIEDIPACKIVYCKIVSGVMTETNAAGEVKEGALNIQDVGNTLINAVGEAELVIDDAVYVDGVVTSFKVSGAGAIDTAVSLFYFGGDTHFSGTKDANGVITPGIYSKTFDSDDVGKVIFWYDGAVSTIKSVTAGVATVFDKVVITVEAQAVMDPNYRTYFDTVNKANRLGQLAFWPLKTRFYKPLPYSDISAYNRGNIVTAVTNRAEIYYSDTNETRLMGYYDVNNQSSSAIDDGIKAIWVVNNLFIVCTLDKTFSVNQRQANVIADTKTGSYYTSLPDPVLVQDGIGTSHQYKVSNGPNGEKIVITNEPAIRSFGPTGYGPNLAEGSIQQTEIQLMSNNMVVDYDKIGGLFIWGKRG